MNYWLLYYCYILLFNIHYRQRIILDFIFWKPIIRTLITIIIIVITIRISKLSKNENKKKNSTHTHTYRRTEGWRRMRNVSEKKTNEQSAEALHIWISCITDASNYHCLIGRHIVELKLKRERENALLEATLIHSFYHSL